MFATVLLAHLALADDPAATAAASAPAPAKAAPTRKNKMEVNVRGRYMVLPGSFLDIGYNAHGDDGYPARPEVKAYAAGLEYVIDGGSSNGIFYVEYIGSLTEDGYWDDREEPDRFEDGSWIEPQGLGLVAIGANYAYEIQATPWLSFPVGAGIGIGIVTGGLVQWVPNDGEHDVTEADCLPGAPTYDRAELCQNDGPVDVPPVLPILDVNVSAKFNISERADIRIEGGLHDLIYGGVAFGIRF